MDPTEGGFAESNIVFASWDLLVYATVGLFVASLCFGGPPNDALPGVY